MPRRTEEDWPGPGTANGIHELVPTVHVIAIDQNHPWPHARDRIVYRLVGGRENGLEALYLRHQSKQRAHNFFTGEN
ncbi:MAG TPA: hypothetical protein VGD02_09870 [Gemmatimonadaceae bacterium]